MPYLDKEDGDFLMELLALMRKTETPDLIYYGAAK